jgi:hypothetical protein
MSNWIKFECRGYSCEDWELSNLPCYFLTKDNKVVLRKVGGLLGKYTHWMPYQKTRPLPPKTSGTYPSDLIAHYEFSMRVFNVLSNNDIYTFGELCKKTELELYRMKGIGRKSINEIKEALQRKGLTSKSPRLFDIDEVEAILRQHARDQSDYDLCPEWWQSKKTELLKGKI